MTYDTIAIAAGGWVLAIGQFLWARREKHQLEESRLLEHTLGYFERGTQARSIALSLIEGIWFKRKKHLNIIVPVLVSQLVFLLRSAEDFGQEERNVFRLLELLHKALPFAEDSQRERIEVLEALLSAASTPGPLEIGNIALGRWYEKLGGDREVFEVETAGDNDAADFGA